MRKIKFLGMFVTFLLFLSGCYNYRELNDLAIVTAISIDYDEKTDNYKVITQVINPIKQQDVSSSGEPTFINFSSEKKSLQEAFRTIVLESPKQLYGSQMQILILSETVVENHLPNVIDFFTRDPEMRSEFKIIIAKNDKTLEGVLLQTVLDDLSSSNILDSLEKQGEILGLTCNLTLNDLTNMYLNPYLEIILPSMVVEGPVEEGEKRENITDTVQKATVKIKTTGIFRGKKLLGYLTEDESKMLNLIRGDLKNTIIRLDTDTGYIVFEPNRIKTKTEADVKKNKVKITIEGFSRIKEVNDMTNLRSVKEIDDLEEKLNKEIEKMAGETFINIRDKYKTDVFKFRDLYYKTDNKYFKENDSNWYEDVYPKLEIEVNSKIELYEKGNTLGGIEYERKN